MPPFGHESVKDEADPLPTQGCVHPGGETFTAVVVDDIQWPDLAAVGELVAHELQ